MLRDIDLCILDSEICVMEAQIDYLQKEMIMEANLHLADKNKWKPKATEKEAQTVDQTDAPQKIGFFKKVINWVTRLITRWKMKFAKKRTETMISKLEAMIESTEGEQVRGIHTTLPKMADFKKFGSTFKETVNDISLSSNEPGVEERSRRVIEKLRGGVVNALGNSVEQNLLPGDIEVLIDIFKEFQSGMDFFINNLEKRIREMKQKENITEEGKEDIDRFSNTMTICGKFVVSCFKLFESMISPLVKSFEIYTQDSEGNWKKQTHGDT